MPNSNRLFHLALFLVLVISSLVSCSKKSAIEEISKKPTIEEMFSKNDYAEIKNLLKSELKSNNDSSLVRVDRILTTSLSNHITQVLLNIEYLLKSDEISNEAKELILSYFLKYEYKIDDMSSLLDEYYTTILKGNNVFTEYAYNWPQNTSIAKWATQQLNNFRLESNYRSQDKGNQNIKAQSAIRILLNSDGLMAETEYDSATLNEAHFYLIRLSSMDSLVRGGIQPLLQKISESQSEISSLKSKASRIEHAALKRGKKQWAAEEKNMSDEEKRQMKQYGIKAYQNATFAMSDDELIEANQAKARARSLERGNSELSQSIDDLIKKIEPIISENEENVQRLLKPPIAK